MNKKYVIIFFAMFVAILAAFLLGHKQAVAPEMPKGGTVEISQ